VHDAGISSCPKASGANACSVVGTVAAQQAATLRCQSGDLENCAKLMVCVCSRTPSCAPLAAGPRPRSPKSRRCAHRVRQCQQGCSGALAAISVAPGESCGVVYLFSRPWGRRGRFLTLAGRRAAGAAP
jgi:hypothetical protein